MEETPAPEFDARRVLPILPGIFPKKMVQADRVVPLEFGDDGCLIIAALKPCSEEVIQKAQFVSNRHIKVALVAEESFAYAIQRYVTYGKPDFSGQTQEELERWFEEEA